LNDFGGFALWASLWFVEQIDLHDRTTTITEARKIACGHTINHASTDHDVDVETTLARSGNF